MEIHSVDLHWGEKLCKCCTIELPGMGSATYDTLKKPPGRLPGRVEWFLSFVDWCRSDFDLAGQLLKPWKDAFDAHGNSGLRDSKFSGNFLS